MNQARYQILVTSTLNNGMAVRIGTGLERVNPFYGGMPTDRLLGACWGNRPMPDTRAVPKG